MDIRIYFQFLGQTDKRYIYIFSKRDIYKTAFQQLTYVGM